MRSIIWAFIFCCVTLQTAAQSGKEFQLSGEKTPGQQHYIAQNVSDEKKEAGDGKEQPSEMPPLPGPKTAITTEKPVKGALQGIVRDKKVTDSIPSAAAPAKTTTVNTAEQPQAAPENQSGKATSDAKQASQAKKKKPPAIKEELSLLNVSTDNLHTIKTLIDDEFNLCGLIYGEERGFIRLHEADNDGNFRETWKSPPLNAAVRELFVKDIDNDGETEIVAYTTQGNIFIYGYNTHNLEYRTPENTYPGISCMVVANLDDDPQLELFYIANKPGIPGKLVQFDPISQFEEWTSTREFSATDMIVGNVDTDSDVEIILNSGEILSSRFKEDIKWKSDIKFGDRLYLLDIDGDGMLELITEYDQSYIRIIEVDERREKW